MRHNRTTIMATVFLLSIVLMPCKPGQGGGKAAETQIASEMVLAKPLQGGGYTWTLATRLGAMLRDSQDKYGKRNLEYTILGVEFSETGPQVWYPGDCKNVAIQLDKDALTDPIRAYYQLAHESIHLLSPTGGRNASVLEEGLATSFAIDYVSITMKNKEYADKCLKSMPENYKSAYDLVTTALKENPDFIKEIRKKHNSISGITADNLQETLPNSSREVCEKLTAKFKY